MIQTDMQGDCAKLQCSSAKSKYVCALISIRLRGRHIVFEHQSSVEHQS